MTINELAEIVCKIVEDKDRIKKAEMENSSICGRKSNYKCGLYFLYNKNDEVVYIGKSGNGKETSLYDRIKGHGNGAHNKKDWYSDVEYGKFHKFEKLNNKQLQIIERLAIYNMGQPKYNDKLISEADINTISNSILSHYQK